MNAQALGWDIHRKFSQVSLEEMNPQGQIHVVERARLEHDDREVLRAWLARLPKGTPVAMDDLRRNWWGSRRSTHPTPC